MTCGSSSVRGPSRSRKVVTPGEVTRKLYRSDKILAAQLTVDTENAKDHSRMIWIVASAVVPDSRRGGVRSRDDFRGRERAENFPVALRALPARYRESLHAAYALARRIDDVGDDPSRTPVERLA